MCRSVPPGLAGTALQGRKVTIHPTACDGLYTCDKLCDDILFRLAKDGAKETCEPRVRAQKPTRGMQSRCAT